MPIGRRPLLVTGFGAAVAGLARGAWAAVLGGGANDPLRALGPFLDTLIPGDAASGSATDLGIEKQLVVLSASRPNYERLLVLGCGWLDSEARNAGASDFAALSPAVREAVVARAEAAPEDTPPRRFFTAVRLQALILYHGDPRSWPALGFEGPPQPIGFPDHDRPPE